MTTFNVFWTRLSPSIPISSENWLEYYCNKSFPEPLPLEGSGLQCVCAVASSEAEEVISNMLKDGHEVRKENAMLQLDDDVQNYCVVMQWSLGSPTSYRLERIG